MNDLDDLLLRDEIFTTSRMPAQFYGQNDIELRALVRAYRAYEQPEMTVLDQDGLLINVEQSCESMTSVVKNDAFEGVRR